MFFWQTHAHFQEKSYDQVRGFCVFARLVARRSHGRHIRLPKMQRKQKKTSGSLKIAWSVTRCSPLSMSSRRSEEHTSELQSLMRISYAVFCLKKKNKINNSIKKDTSK